jgi:peptidoglycan hydrolase-like protein with peptidoglycan-binding domain
MSTTAPETAYADDRAGLLTRRWRWVAAGAVVTAAVAATAAFTHHRKPRTQPPTYPTSTATVDRRSLVSQTRVAATWGYGGAYTVVNQAPGTITKLPKVGQVVRQGKVLYRVSGRPIVLLYGPVPAYRSLSYGMTGPDVAELNTALTALGYTSRPWNRRYFGRETAGALERLQHHLGMSRTGELALGNAVFLPRAARVTARGAGVLGGPARPGMTLLEATSTTPMVTIDLDAVQQTQVKAGDKVTITLPSGQTTPGLVSSVGRVAKKRGSTPTITVKVTPTAAKATALDQAPVQVSIVTGRVRDALVVPVTALLAQTGGGYAVEVTGPRRLVPVSPGLFDDADGLVQVTGAGLTAGQHVVVPTA